MTDQVSEHHAVIAVSGPPVKLSPRRFSVSEGLNQLFSVRVMANCLDSNVDLEEIVGHPALFQLSGGQLHAQYGTRRWTGIVAHAEQVHVDPTSTGESTYYFHIVPTLYLTTQRRETRIFQHIKIPDIIKTILDEWGIESLNELNGFYREHEYIVQYNETDHAFINRLCEWAGITYYFKFQSQETDGWEHGTKTKPRTKKELKSKDPAKEAERKEEEKRDKANRAADANMHAGWTTINEPGEPDDAIHEDSAQKDPAAAVALKLAFSDGVHENEVRALPIHYVDEPNEAAQEEFITECRLTYNVAPGRHTIRDFDYRGKLDFQLFGKEKTPAEVPEDFYEQYHYEPGAFKAAADSKELEVGDKANAYRNLQTEVGTPMAQMRWHADRFNRRLVRFVTNCVDLGPGVVFTMSHHPRADLDLKKYLIRKFTLEGHVNDKWTFEGEAQFQSDAFYPELTTPKPRIRGLQSAVVTGPKGKEEIFCDELGRVKVQFHWDRDGKYDDKSSCWVRVSHDWAGTGFGTQFLPRIGQEVLIAFLEGDPDSPVIVGRVYNGINKVLYDLPTFKERSYWKTDSTPQADGFSELAFEDRKDQEKIFLQAETDVQKLVKQYETHRIGNDLMTVVGEHRTSVVSKLDSLMVGERYLLRSVKPPKEEFNTKNKVKKGDDLAIPTLDQPNISPLKTAIDIKDKQVIFTTGAATVAFDDKNIRIQADGNIHVKAKGADCIIEGVKVHLNPGSAAPDAPKSLPFTLPKHDGWKRLVAELLDDMKQKLKRNEIGAITLAPPKPPSFVAQDDPELHKCFLMATLVHCMHPNAPREPCQNELRDDFHRLEIVPDPPELAGRTPGMEGEGQRGTMKGDKPNILVRPSGDSDPRQRYDRHGKKLAEGEKGGYVKKHGDVITLKSKVNDNCGKHTSWRVTGFSPIQTKESAENWSVEVPGWIHSRLANWNFTSHDLDKVASAWLNAKGDVANEKASRDTGYGEAREELKRAEFNHFRKGTDESERELQQAQATHDIRKKNYEAIASPERKPKWGLPFQARVKGLSWTAGVSPKRYDITASACTGAAHKYTLLSYPSDQFSIDFGFGKDQLFEPLKSWLCHPMPKADTFVGEFALAINSNVYLGASAGWKEYARDHRAFYQYKIKLTAEPLFSASGSYTIHLYHILSWIPGLQWAGVGARAFKRFFDVAFSVKLTGEISGEIAFSRDGPDDLSGSTSGSIKGVLTLAFSGDAFVVSKDIAGAGMGGKTSMSCTLTPKKDCSPMEPPTLVAKGEWKGFTISFYGGIKFLRRGERSVEVAKAKPFGPKEVKWMAWVNEKLDKKYREL